jgi:hypothetical protein
MQNAPHLDIWIDDRHPHSSTISTPGPSQHRDHLTQSTILMPHNSGAYAEQVTLSMDNPTSNDGDYALVACREEKYTAKYS